MALQNLDANIKYAKAKKSRGLSQEETDEFNKRFDEILVGEHRLRMTIRGERDTAARTGRRPR